MAKPNFSEDISYHSLNGKGEKTHEPNQPPGPRFNIQSRGSDSADRSWIRTLLFQTFVILWLAPMLAFVVLNLKGHIIGASAWCPGSHCYIDAFNLDPSVPQDNIRKFDQDNHNLLGALQFVAKALEMWFVVITGAFVYLITMILAGRKDAGLPVGYLTRPSEYSELVGLFDKLLWSTLPTLRGRKSGGLGNARSKLLIYVFIFLTIVLCVLCNLMGPAVAVLIIPALQWIHVDAHSTQAVSGWNSVNPPSLNGFYFNQTSCNTDQIARNAYSCGASTYALLLDALVSSYAASNTFTAVAQQGYVSFTFNQSFQTDSNGEVGDYIYWSPNFQLLQDFTEDITRIADISNDTTPAVISDSEYESYIPYNRSLQVVVERNGPILGATPTMWLSYNGTQDWTTQIDSDRALRCWASYDIGNTPLAEGVVSGNYTKCVRTGSGWSSNNKAANFSVAGVYNNNTSRLGPGVSVNIITSDKAVFLENGTIPSWLPAQCLDPGVISSQTTCDWDRLFTLNEGTSIANRTQNVNTIQMLMNFTSGYVELNVDFVAMSNFIKYDLDPLPFSNPMRLVQTASLPTDGQTIPVDPAWIVAAWSADIGGVVPANRTSSLLLLEVMQSFWQNQTMGILNSDFNVDLISLLPVMQTLSMIEYNTTQTSGNSANTDLKWSARIYVWAWAMSGRTSYVGVIVAIAGIAVAAAQAILGFVDRREYRSPTQLLVAALQHAPQGEFDIVGQSESEAAKVPFHVRDVDHRVQSFKFFSPQASNVVHQVS